MSHGVTKQRKLEQAKRAFLHADSGLTPSELAASLGVNRVTAHRYINDLTDVLQKIGDGVYIYRPTPDDLETAFLILEHSNEIPTHYLEKRKMKQQQDQVLQRLNKIATSIPYQNRTFHPYQVVHSQNQYFLIGPYRKDSPKPRPEPIGDTAKEALLRILAVKGYWGHRSNKLSQEDTQTGHSELFSPPQYDQLVYDIITLCAQPTDTLRRILGLVSYLHSNLTALNNNLQYALAAGCYRLTYTKQIVSYIAALRGILIFDEPPNNVLNIKTLCRDLNINVDTWLTEFQQPDLSHTYTAQELTQLLRSIGNQHEIVQDDAGFWDKWPLEEIRQINQYTREALKESPVYIPQHIDEPLDEETSYTYLGTSSYTAAREVFTDINNYRASQAIAQHIPNGWPQSNTWWSLDSRIRATYLFDRINEIPGVPVWDSLEPIQALLEPLEFLTNILDPLYFTEHLWGLIGTTNEILNWVCVERGDYNFADHHSAESDDDLIEQLEIMWDTAAELFDMTEGIDSPLTENWDEVQPYTPA